MHDIQRRHDHVPDQADEEAHPLWKLDSIALTSVGIDIGTATSQINFSRLVLRRLGDRLSSRFMVAERETLYLSPVHFTPYTAHRNRIDDQELKRLVDIAYRESGIGPGAVDTGAIILTGEAIRRDNARAIADLFAAQRGKFVCASAGHNFEALLAAHGSGAVASSSEQACRVLNVDIGGGTTKLAVADRGRVLDTAVFHIGSRLLAMDGNGVITVLEPGGRALSGLAGLQWKVGDRPTGEQIQSLADRIAQIFISLLTDEDTTAEVQSLWLTRPLSGPREYDAVTFSGGVGEYVYGRETETFGDMGSPLGRALRREIGQGVLPWPLVSARECIRATVMGASQYTVQVSGNTIYRSSDGLLPKKNLQVLRPPLELGDRIEPLAVARAIAGHFQTFDLNEGDDEVALVFQWQGIPSAIRIDGFCRGLLAGLAGTLRAKRPLYLVFDHDMARLAGTVLKKDLGLQNELVALDGIQLRDFDYIDLGSVLEPSGTVPVTIKSLVFRL